MCLFNEMMVTCYLYVLLTLTDFHATVNPLRDQSGTGLTAIILFTVSASVAKFLVIKIIQINGWCKRRQMLKAQKYVTESKVEEDDVAKKD